MMLFYWIVILVIHWAFVQNDPADWEDLDNIEINFDPLYFFTWLMGALFIAAR